MANTSRYTQPTWRALDAFIFVQAAQRPIYIAINTSTPSISTLTPNVLAWLGLWSHIRMMRVLDGAHATNFVAI